MISFGPQALAKLKQGDFLSASCLDLTLVSTFKITNSGAQISDYLANGMLNEPERGVLDSSENGENRRVEINDPDGIIYAEAISNNPRGKAIVLSIAFLDPNTYRVLDDQIYEDFAGFIDSVSYSHNVLTINAVDQYALEYQNGRRSNDASIKRHFQYDTSHEHLAKLPTEIKWGSIKI